MTDISSGPAVADGADPATGGSDAAAPWHLWAVGVVALLWNCIGAYDYIMSQTRNADYMRMMTEPYGYDTQAAVEYFDSFPLWADTAWALGVWGAVAGSVLLLLRSRYAFHAFVVSLIGLVGANVHSLQNPLPGLSDSAMALGMTAAITAITLLLIWYARRQTAAGVLR
ncbi:hypothetical protein [Tsuneonella sp. HG222]